MSTYNKLISGMNLREIKKILQLIIEKQNYGKKKYD
jgi:hypothetical protein